MSDQPVRKGLFVNIKETTKAQLDKFKIEYPAYTHGSIIEKLLDNFASLSDAERKDILEQGASDTFKKVGDLLSLSLWANNSFNLGHQGNKAAWISALEYYRQLEKVTDRLGGIKNFCIYRQAYVLAEIGLCIRQEAIEAIKKNDEMSIESCYTLACDALEKAISYYGKLRHDVEEGNTVEKKTHIYPTIFYNMACARAQIAQFQVERELARPSQQKGKRATQLKTIVDLLGGSHSDELADSAWKSIGTMWREFVHPRVKKDVEQLAGQAMRHLRHAQTVSIAEGTPHLQRILEYALIDLDLIFLRRDAESQSAFNDFLAAAARETFSGHFASAYSKLYPDNGA